METVVGYSGSATQDDSSKPASNDIAEAAGRFGNLRIGINGVAMLSPLTGIGQYTVNLVRELQKMHLEPWMFYGSNWRQEIRAASVPGISAAKSLFKKFIPRPYATQRFFMQRRFSIGPSVPRLDLYHEPGFMPFRFDGPTVITVHDLSWIRYPETQPPDRVREMNRQMPAAIEKSAHILVVSDYVRRELMDHFGVGEDRITTTHEGVSDEFQPLSPDQSRPILAKYGLNFGGYILVVATLEPRKNLDTAVAAFARLPVQTRRRFPLIIVGMRGWGDSLASESLRRMVSCGEIRLTGYVPQGDLPVLYSGARLFVFPSLYEGFGLPPLEAMACGVPVIASNRGSVPEVVANAGVLIDPYDDAGIAGHIQELIEDNALHQSLSAGGRIRARIFTWRRCAEETVEIYAKTIRSM